MDHVVYHPASEEENEGYEWRCRRHVGTDEACEKEWVEEDFRKSGGFLKRAGEWKRGDRTPCPACLGLTERIEVCLFFKKSLFLPFGTWKLRGT